MCRCLLSVNYLPIFGSKYLPKGWRKVKDQIFISGLIVKERNLWLTAHPISVIPRYLLEPRLTLSLWSNSKFLMWFFCFDNAPLILCKYFMCDRWIGSLNFPIILFHYFILFSSPSYRHCPLNILLWQLIVELLTIRTYQTWIWFLFSR